MIASQSDMASQSVAEARRLQRAMFVGRFGLTLVAEAARIRSDFHIEDRIAVVPRHAA